MLTMPVAIAMRSVAASSPSTSVRSAGGEPPIQMAPKPSASTSRASSGVKPACRLQKPYRPSSTVMIGQRSRGPPAFRCGGPVSDRDGGADDGDGGLGARARRLVDAEALDREPREVRVGRDAPREGRAEEAVARRGVG